MTARHNHTTMIVKIYDGNRGVTVTWFEKEGGDKIEMTQAFSDMQGCTKFLEELAEEDSEK